MATLDAHKPWSRIIGKSTLARECGSYVRDRRGGETFVFFYYKYDSSWIPITDVELYDPLAHPDEDLSDEELDCALKEIKDRKGENLPPETPPPPNQLEVGTFVIDKYTYHPPWPGRICKDTAGSWYEDIEDGNRIYHIKETHMGDVTAPPWSFWATRENIWIFTQEYLKQKYVQPCNKYYLKYHSAVAKTWELIQN